MNPSNHVRLNPLRPQYLLDEIVPFRVSGLTPGQRVVLELEHIDNVQQRWLASADMSGDAQGIADTADAPSRSGSYTGVSQDGLLWSLAPEGVEDAMTFMREARSPMHFGGQPGGERLQPRMYTLRARVDSIEVASASFGLSRIAPDVRVQELNDGPIRGVAFHAAGPGPRRGAIMTVTGSGGGVDLIHGPMLASRGFDVLALAHFAYPGRPDELTEIELEYFAEAAAWMRQTFGVERIAVQGGSRGGELALVLASYLPEVFCGAVPLSAWHNVVAGWFGARQVHEGPAWMLRGQPLPYCMVRFDMDRAQREAVGGAMAFSPDYLRDAAGDEDDARCAIPVERCSGPLLLISGRDDQVWPAWYGADRVMDRLRAHGRAHLGEHLALENVGHAITLPSLPTSMSWAMYHPLAKMPLLCGGQPQATARGVRQAWSRMLSFYGELFAQPGA